MTWRGGGVTSRGEGAYPPRMDSERHPLTVPQNKFDWAGKTRNESLLRTPPAAPAADEE